MASIIRIKRSSVSGNPGTLGAGELAYSALTDNGSNGGDRLYIGIGAETSGNAANHFVIGGKYFTDLMDHTPGVLTATSALLVDADKKLDELLVDNLSLNGNSITSTDTNGNITLTPNGTGKLVLNNVYINGTTDSLAEYIFDTVGGAITGGTGITVTNSDAGDTSTVSITNTTVTEGSYGSSTAIPTFTVNAQGQLTAAGTATVATVLNIAGETGTDTVNLLTDTLTFSGTTGITATVSDNTVDISIDSTVTTLTGTQTLTNKTLTSPSLTTPIIGSGGAIFSGTTGTTTVKASASAGSTTLTLPAATDTLVGKATTDTLTNKTISFSSNTITMTSAELATAVSDETGTGVVVFSNSPTLVTPTLGAALATSITATSGNMTINAATGNNSVNLVPTGTGSVDVANKRITSVAEPTQSSDAATKNYVDAVKTGLDVKDSVRVTTNTNLTATYDNGTSGVGATLTNSGTQAALTVDSIVLSVNDRILVKDQSTGLQNGFYKVTDTGSASTNWVLTRSIDADEDSEVTPGAFTFVEEGTVGQNNGYVCTTNGTITIGTSPISFVQFSGAGSVIAGAGLTKDGNTLDVVGTTDRISISADAVDIASTYVGQTSITTLGTITSGTWNASIVAGQYGGTGVANTGKTITVGGNFETVGANAVSLTSTGTTSIVLPTTGTLATLAGSETLSNKTITASSIGSSTPGTAAFTTLTANGAVTLTSATDSSSISTGAVVVSGGVGIAKKLYVGDNVVIAANLTGAGAATSILSGFDIDGGTY